jgi:hypothetical protein
MAAAMTLIGGVALAQQPTVSPGSPGATTTINGDQLPPPPSPFRGEIDRNAAQSKPYWPPRVEPPKGAPNVLLIITEEGAQALAPGRHTLEFDFRYDGLGIGTLAFNSLSGIGRGGTGVLKVDGQAVATEKMQRTIALILQWDENLDIGADTGTPVDDKDYQVPFTFTGKINTVTLTIDRPKLTPADEKRLTDTERNRAIQ